MLTKEKTKTCIICGNNKVTGKHCFKCGEKVTGCEAVETVCRNCKYRFPNSKHLFCEQCGEERVIVI